MTMRHRRHSTAKKREVVEAYLNGEALRTLSERHDVCRGLIRIWIEKHERGAHGAPAPDVRVGQAGLNRPGTAWKRPRKTAERDVRPPSQVPKAKGGTACYGVGLLHAMRNDQHSSIIGALIGQGHSP